MFSLIVPDGKPAESLPVTRSQPGIDQIWAGPVLFVPGLWPHLFWAGLFCNRLAARFYSLPYRLLLCLQSGPCSSPELYSGQPQPRPDCNPISLRILPGQARLIARICSSPFQAIRPRAEYPCRLPEFFLSGLFGFLKGPVHSGHDQILHNFLIVRIYNILVEFDRKNLSFTVGSYFYHSATRIGLNNNLRKPLLGFFHFGLHIRDLPEHICHIKLAHTDLPDLI